MICENLDAFGRRAGRTVKRVTRRIGEERKEYPFLEVVTIRVKSQGRPDIGEQRESERIRGGGKEKERNVLRKDYDTERRLFEGNGYRDLSDARTVEISIDSQLGRIPSVVSAPMPHPPNSSSHSLRQPSSFHFSAAVVSLRDFKSLSPSVRRYLDRKGFSHNDALI